jgi:hypothetical protein
MSGWWCGTDCTARRQSGWDTLIASLLSALLLSPFGATAADVTPVHFAGFAYVGDDASTSASYPNTHRIEAERVGDVSVLDDALRRHLQGLANPSFSLQFGSLASLKAGHGSATVLAFALDRESISVEQIGTKHKLVTELSAQALFVDFREMAVVATFPIVVQAIDILDAPPTSEQIAQAVRDLYLGDGKANIFAAFSATLADTQLNPTIERRVRVVDATIADGARAAMPALAGAAPGVAEAALAQDFSKFLSVNQRIPVLPTSKGHAIGNRMAARFADGTVYTLSIPEADYAISLRLDELKRVDYASNAAGRSLIYGAFMQVRVEEPLTGKVYFDARLRNGATKSVPASQQNIDDSAAYQDALLALMDRFTVALTDSDPAWAEKHAGDRAVAKQMKELEKVLQSCR